MNLRAHWTFNADLTVDEQIITGMNDAVNSLFVNGSLRTYRQSYELSDSLRTVKNEVDFRHSQGVVFIESTLVKVLRGSKWRGYLKLTAKSEWIG